jgi:hypothetical protein
MSIKPGLRDLLWMAGGAVVVGALLLAALHFGDSVASEHADRIRKLELVDRMRAAVAAASESEQSAVVAGTDADSAAFAEAARAAMAELDRHRQELSELIGAGGPEAERSSLASFASAFESFRGVGEELLALAVRNSNLKASALASGPAAEAVQSMTEALAGLTSASGDPAPMALAFRAQVAALRELALLPPHIAEAREEVMDGLEARMAEQEQEVQRDLDGLRARPELAGAAGLQAATSAWAQFLELKAQVIALSRENSNVRSHALSLDRRRTAMLACLQALDSVRQAIAAEPAESQPPRPR